MFSQSNRREFSCLGFIFPLFVVFVLVACFSNAAHAAVGRTPGTFAISPSGAATYTIPIWSPSGTHGVQPRIALTYNSQQRDGYVGVGWSVSGLSSIYRCNLTYAQDAAPAPVSLSTSDGYCLDGRRLRLTFGTYGTAGSTYQTEIANFSNVTAYGSAGNGPAYFQVQAPDGRTYEYGNGSGGNNSQVLADGTTASVWYLDKVTDGSGNTMSIAYAASSSNLEGLTVPIKISWTPTSQGATSYAYTMTFVYQTISTAPPNQAGYVAGTVAQSFYLMTNIQIAYSGTLVKNYVLTYATSGTTGRQTLMSVQECADAAQSNCLSPTTMSWQAGAAGLGSGTAVSGSMSSVISTAFDMSGDGTNDLVSATSTGAVQVDFAGANGYSTLVSAPAGASERALGDIDGSGVAGLLVNVSGTWYYYRWNGSAFAGTSTGISVATAASPVLADLDGDGRADFVYTDSTGIVHVRLSTSTAGTVSFGADINSNIGTSNFSISAQTPGSNRALHFWGDNQADLLGKEQTCAQYDAKGICTAYQYIYYELHFTGSTFITGGVNASAIDFADYNDDGCTDILTATQLFLSDCNGTEATPVALPSGVTAVGGMDWNGDGRRDVLVAQSNGYLGVVLSTGTGLASTVINTSYPTSGNYYTAAPNLTGDGQDGLLQWNSTSATYYLHESPGAPPDLLASISDGYGNSVAPSYVSLARSVYSTYFEWNDAQYPYENYNGPVYLVNQAVFSDPSNPSGGTYYQNYFYAGLWLNLQGRGLSPLGAVQTYDSRKSGFWDTRNYERAFPYTGILGSENTTSNNSSSGILSFVTTTPANTVISDTSYQQVYFPYLSNQTVQSYEMGSSSTRLVRTTATTYTYDNYGNATQITATVTDNDSGSPYYNQSWTVATTNTPDPDPSTGCLDLFTETQVAYTDSNNDTPVTRTRQFTPDLTHCQYTKIVTEPSSSTYKVTEDLRYDGFGNVSSDTITGIGMTARTTTAIWSNSTYTTGQFPLSVTDASGATTQFAYNYSFGVLGSVTDPNGETTSWLYSDGFGRKTQETRPNGTYTIWNYLDCTLNGNDCLLGSHTLQVDRLDMKTDGSALSSGSTFFDELERPFLKNDYMIGGGHDRYELRFDSLGHIQQQALPCVWSSVATTCPYWSTFTYDVLGRPTQAQRPISSTNGTLQTTGYQYAGDTTTVTDPQGNSQTLINDPNGWLRQSKDAYGYTVTLAYDAAGSKTSVTDSQGNTLWTGSYAYGIQPFLLGFTDMDLGGWGFTVDALGEKTAWTDAKSQHFSATYDPLSRPLTRSEPDLFTQWTWGSTPSAHNVGMLQSVCTGVGSNPSVCSGSGVSESRSYDGYARLFQRTINLPSSSTSYAYTWQYEATTGLLDTLTYPVSTSGYSLTVQYGYSSGILTSVADISDTPNVPLWQANAQNAAGQITQETLGNNVVVARTIDDVTHWLGSIQAGLSGGAGIQNQSFLYDEMGNLTQRQDNNGGLTENIYYDSDYRLSYSKLNGTQNFSVNYDVTGNITSRSDLASGATWTYDTVHKHAVTQAGSSAYQYSYDANGNAITRQGSSIAWSSYNYPTAISAGSGSTAESVAFSYGPDRQRWQQQYQGNGTTEITNYIGPGLEMVSSGGVTDYRHYIYAGGKVVAVYSRKSNGSNAFSYLLSDHQGGVASVTSSAGASVVNESFTPFGARRNPATWSGAASTSDLTAAANITRQGYTFQTQLGLWMGLNHMNGRVEDATTGRFLSPDPTIPYLTNTQGYNRYAYTNNNPLTLVDPTGFDDKPSCAGDNFCGGGTPGGSSPGYQPPEVSCTDPACTQTVQGTPSPYVPATNSSPNLNTGGSVKAAQEEPQGKQYQTKNAAGIAGACAFNPISMMPTDSHPYGTEYSGFVYKNDNGSYSYTNAYPGTDDRSGPSQAMTYYPQTPVAWFHTHGGYDPSLGPGNNVFSPDDIAFSNATGKPNYMANPANNVQVYDPSTRSVTQFGSCNKHQ